MLQAQMFEPKHRSRDKLVTYIGARVSDAEQAWLRAEMARRELSMSDLIRAGLRKLRTSRAGLL